VRSIWCINKSSLMWAGFSMLKDVAKDLNC
jgi:hypothetical protein